MSLEIISTGTWRNLGLACFASAGAFVTRNVLLGVVCKAGSVGLNFFDNQVKVAEWDKASHYYFTQARKNALRDLIAAVGIVALGAGCFKAADIIDTRLLEKERVLKEKDLFDRRVKKATKIIKSLTVGGVIYFSCTHANLVRSLILFEFTKWHIFNKPITGLSLAIFRLSSLFANRQLQQSDIYRQYQKTNKK